MSPSPVYKTQADDWNDVGDNVHTFHVLRNVIDT